MQKKQIIEYLDTVIIGSGLSALNFIDTFSKKKRKLMLFHQISILIYLK